MSQTPLDIKCPKTDKPVYDMGTYFWFPGYPKTYCLKVLNQREMKPEEYAAAFQGEETVLEGFVGKNDKPFNAMLRYDSELERIGFEFPPENPMDINCPKSGKPIDNREKYFMFPGYPDIRFWKSVAGRDMSAEDYILVLENHPTPVEFHNFYSTKKQRPFSAPVRLNEENNEIELAFDDKKSKGKGKGKGKASSSGSSTSAPTSDAATSDLDDF